MKGRKQLACSFSFSLFIFIFNLIFHFNFHCSRYRIAPHRTATDHARPSSAPAPTRTRLPREPVSL
jgi:hypothetical protein